jgi:hypothetical protein
MGPAATFIKKSLREYLTSYWSAINIQVGSKLLDWSQLLGWAARVEEHRG